MKSLRKLSLIAIAVMSVTACNNNQSAEKVDLETQEAKEAYSLGASIGSYISKQLQEQKTAGLTLDNELIMHGFKQGLANNTQLTEEEIKEILQGLDKKVTEQRRVKAEEVAKENLKKGDEFLKANKSKKGVKTTGSGLQYEVLKETKGEKPALEDIVEVHYRGTLIDGTEFDSSYARKQPAKFPLARVIPGWSEGVQLMTKGSKYKFVIPSSLAYGEHGAGDIPANSTLIFEVELLSIEKAGSSKDKAKSVKKAAINKKVAEVAQPQVAAKQ